MTGVAWMGGWDVTGSIIVRRNWCGDGDPTSRTIHQPSTTIRQQLDNIIQQLDND